MRYFLPLSRIGFFGIVIVLSGIGSFAQSPSSQSATQTGPAQSASPAPPPAEQHGQDEVSTHDMPTTFKVRVNLVQVRVVVRDDSGKVVPNLHREDFSDFR